jgi:mono/diheme cytochrome c family protein
MKKCIFLAVSLALSVVTVVSCNQAESKPAVADNIISPDSLLKHGHYLVTIMGCNDCHSPKVFGPHGPEPDTSRLLSGHPADMPIAKIDTNTTKSWVLFNMTATAIVGPWGVSFAANISSDATGIGNWTETQFAKALREGKSKGLDGARMLLPPMPWPCYTQLKDEDLKAIFAYLKSTRPIRNIVPAPIPPSQINKKG